MKHTHMVVITMHRFAWLFMALPLWLASCQGILGKRIHGDGNIRTEDRPVSNFKNVNVSGSAKIMVSQDEHSSVKIEADENLLQYIEVIQQGDKVIIREREGFHLIPSGELRVYVSTPVYNNIDVSGACDIIGQNKITNPEALGMEVDGAGDIKMEVDAPRLQATVTGSGSIYLKGQTKDVSLDLTGSGHAHCYDLLAENTKVEISGAGNAEVYASVKLDANVSGAGTVTYKGNATDVSQSVGGAGSVHKAD